MSTVVDPELTPSSHAPECPECGLELGVPAQERQADAAVDEMLCMSCGNEWRESDAEAVARVWYGLGAHHESMNSD